ERHRQPQTKLNGAVAPGTNLASSAFTPNPGGTVAKLNGTVVAGGDVQVQANDWLSVQGVAGSVAGGVVGVGASILVLTVKSNTASVGNVQLGGPGVGETVAHLTVSNTDTITLDMFALAVGGGAVSIGGGLAFTDMSGTASSSSAAHGTVGAGGVTVQTIGSH